MLRDDFSFKGIEKDANIYFARMLLAEYIKRVSGDNTTESWFFSLRGNCPLSLNRHMGLSPRSYAALLMAADFVQVRQTGVRLNNRGFVDGWMKKDHYGLGGDSLGCSECTFSGVLLDKLNRSADARMKELHLIRIGYYKEQGETINAAAAINGGFKPPPHCHRIRTIQRWFSLNIRSIISDYYNHKDLPRVEEWVRYAEVGLDDNVNIHHSIDRSITKQETTTTTTATASVTAPAQKKGMAKVPPETLLNAITPDAKKTDAMMKPNANGSVVVSVSLVGDDMMDTDTDSDDESTESDDESYYEPPSNGSEYNEDFAEQYPLLANIALPLFNMDQRSSARNMLPKMHRQNMLRELTTLMASYGDALEFESLNSRQNTKLQTFTVSGNQVHDFLLFPKTMLFFSAPIVVTTLNCGMQLLRLFTKRILVKHIASKPRKLLIWQWLNIAN